jgi:predicted dehydrogenase
MTNKLSVGLIGCGRWGRHILRDLLSLGCDVTVVNRGEAGQRNARDGRATAIVECIGQLPHISGVVVATPTNTHAQVIESLLGLNVPIFTEKPMTADRESALLLARKAPERLFVMDKWRYHAGIEMLREIARTEELGPVEDLRTTRAQWGNPHADVDISWILTPHDLSIALEVLGKIPKPRHAIAEKTDGKLTGLLGILGGGPDGVGDPWLIVEVSSRHPQRRREVRLHCRDGVAILDDGYSAGITVTRSRNSRAGQMPESELRPISQELPLLRELRAFVEHLQGGPPPRSSAAEGALIVSAIADLRSLAGLDKE